MANKDKKDLQKRAAEGIKCNFIKDLTSNNFLQTQWPNIPNLLAY